MDVSIVIINYNTYKLTCNCLQSVFERTNGISYEVILVDNASSEIEPIRFETLFPALKVIRLPNNLGFAGGNNVGISYATGKYLLLLNSDTILVDNSVLTTYNYLEHHPDAGVVSSKLVFPDGRHQSVAQRFPSIRYQLFELFRIQKLIGKTKGGRLLLGSFFDHNSNAVVDWVWGTYFMFRKEILHKLPGKKLDESYFMYAEDMQWCWDIKKLGYEIHFCAETTVVHLMGGSSADKSKNMQESGDKFFVRNYGKLSRWGINKLQKVLTHD